MVVRGDSSADDATTPEALDRNDRASRSRVLLFWDGGSAHFWVPAGGEVTIGRGAEAEVRVDHSSVSRTHARVRGPSSGSPLLIEDLGSRNGVRVRGERLSPHAPTPISPGDVVELGSVMLVLQGAPQPAAPRSIPVTVPPEGGAMSAIGRLVELVAASDIGVLLLGETGVGKTITAEAIHRRSARAAGPFVRFNCAAFPEQLVESELFGYERGAFTGAMQAKQGQLESAEGGTVFLDEIGEMPLGAQAKLLSVIENREVTRLGGIKPRSIDVRFISATNRDLPKCIGAGAFREDLYFRLSGIPITLPPLRERVAEIPALAARFLEQARTRLGKPTLEIADDALARLTAHAWPGNLRELKNTIERAAVLAGDETVRGSHIIMDIAPAPTSTRSEAPPSVPTASADPESVPRRSLKSELDALERAKIVEALEKCNGNQTRAAALLGTSRRALINRIAHYGLPRPRK